MTDSSNGEEIRIYPARNVVTMNPAQPNAEAVAVRGDRILAVGSVESLATWGETVVDDRFADKVLVPGFIEAHSHVMAGGMWTMPYVGFFDRNGADGKLWTGCKSIDAVIDRLIEAEAALEDPQEPLLAWDSTRSISTVNACWPPTSIGSAKPGRSSSTTQAPTSRR